MFAMYLAIRPTDRPTGNDILFLLGRPRDTRLILKWAGEKEHISSFFNWLELTYP